MFRWSLNQKCTVGVAGWEYAIDSDVVSVSLVSRVQVLAAKLNVGTYTSSFYSEEKQSPAGWLVGKFSRRVVFPFDPKRKSFECRREYSSWCRNGSERIHKALQLKYCWLKFQRSHNSCQWKFFLVTTFVWSSQMVDLILVSAHHERCWKILFGGFQSTMTNKAKFITLAVKACSNYKTDNLLVQYLFKKKYATRLSCNITKLKWVVE